MIGDDNPRLLELLRRVHADPALTELERLEEAERELVLVLQSAPDNLPANRALAEVFQKRGQMPEALAQYRKALELAKFDPDLASEVTGIENVVTPPPPPVVSTTPATPVEDLFDFDTLIEQLGGRTQPVLKFDAPTGIEAQAPIAPAPSALDAVELREDDADSFSLLERQLRQNEDAGPMLDAAPEPEVAAPSEEEVAEQQMLAELEEWLSAIAVAHDQHPSA